MIGHSYRLTESRQTLQLILRLIKYNEFQWKFCCDLKVVHFLLGMKNGNPRMPCIGCCWNRMTMQFQEAAAGKRKTNSRTGLLVVNDFESVKETPLVCAENFIIPPLHIKLGIGSRILKHFVKRNPHVFEFIKQKYHWKDIKIANGYVTGPNLRKLFADQDFLDILDSYKESNEEESDDQDEQKTETENSTEEEDNSEDDGEQEFEDESEQESENEEDRDAEKQAWLACKAVCEEFLGKARSPNYAELIQDMLAKYEAISCPQTVKMHYLQCHLDRFPENCSDESDEHGERLHQELKWYQQNFPTNKIGINLLAAYSFDQSIVFKKMQKQ